MFKKDFTKIDRLIRITLVSEVKNREHEADIYYHSFKKGTKFLWSHKNNLIPFTETRVK